jgi:hypothetical protein
MWWLIRPLSFVFDLVMAPLAVLPAALGLAVLALATAVGLLWVFCRTLDAGRVELAKRRMQAAIFEMRLFEDDLREVVRAARQVLRHNGAYVRAWLVPVLVASLPLMLLMAQIDGYYGRTGIMPSESTLVLAELDPIGNSERPLVLLDAPAGLRLETSPVWFPAAGQMVWRISPRTEGEFELVLRAGRDVVTKAVRASDEVARRSPRRARDDFYDALRYPSEPPLPGDSPIAALSVEYPERQISFLGWQTHWLVPYVGFLVVFAFALRRRFGVVF